MADHDGIVSITDARRTSSDGESTFFESEFWARLGHAADAESFAHTWLDIQCRMFDGVIRGTVVTRASEVGNFTPIALWPEGITGSQKLATVVEIALTERRATIQGMTRNPRRQDPVFIAHPIVVDDHVWTEDQLPWLRVEDDLPRFSRNSSASPSRAPGSN